MKILNLATTDMFGAGIAAQFLNQKFIEQGFESILIVKESTLSNKNVIIINKYKSKFEFNFIRQKLIEGYLYQWILQKMKFLKKRFYFFNFNERKEIVSAQTIIDHLPFQPDIIILHWISLFLNMKTISNIQKGTNAKVFWIMMDNAPLTGGCHYPWNCNGFISNCKNCKAINCFLLNQLASKNHKLKMEHLPKDLTLICCSESDYKRAKNASLFINNPIEKIILPVNSNIFFKKNKNESKRKLNIPNSTKVIFYGSISVSDERKGFSHFVTSIKKLREIIVEEKQNIDNFLILVAGKATKKVINLLDIPVLNVGYLNEEDLSNSYNAADIYVSTSIEDSGPYMINQSIMCGTPVVAFEMGVALDLVLENQTGSLIKNFDSKEMAEAIYSILSLNSDDYERLSSNCIILGKEKCSNFASNLLFNNIKQ